MKNNHITCDAIDCKYLLYSMKQFHCAINRRVTDIDTCMRCKFAYQRAYEATLKKAKING